MHRPESYTAPSKNSKKLLIAPAFNLPEDPAQAALTIGWMENPNCGKFQITQPAGRLDKAFASTKLDIPYALAIARKANREKFDAVLALREGTGYPLALLKRAGLLKPDLVIINHGAANPGPLRTKRGFVQAVKDHWDMMVCISPSEAQTFINLYRADPSKVTDVMLPYNTDYFKSDPLTIQKDSILSTGVSHRDYPTLIEAMRTLNHASSGPKLVIDAYSPSDPLKDRSWERRLPANVIKEHYPDPHAFKVAVNSSRFIALAIDPKTGQGDAGCTLAQAAASMEKPIVAASNGLADYIINNVTGLIVPGGDVQGLAQAINELWYNPDLRARLAKNAREFALETFSRQSWTQRIRSTVESIN